MKATARTIVNHLWYIVSGEYGLFSINICYSGICNIGKVTQFFIRSVFDWFLFKLVHHTGSQQDHAGIHAVRVSNKGSC